MNFDTSCDKPMGRRDSKYSLLKIAYTVNPRFNKPRFTQNPVMSALSAKTEHFHLLKHN